MKRMTLLLVWLSVASIVGVPLVAYPEIQTNTAATPMDEPSQAGDVDSLEDDFSPGLGLFALFMIVILLMIVGAGAVLAIVIVCAVACLAAFGILTASTVVGVVSKRSRTALKAFFLQVGGVVGLSVGAGLAVLAKFLFESRYLTWSIVAAGALAGLIGGLLLSALFNFAWSKLLARFSADRERGKTSVGLPSR